MAMLSVSGKIGLERTVGQFMRQYDAARQTQQELIGGILKRNARTVFGKEHGFVKIKTVADYQRQVPIRSWAEISPYVDALVEGRLDTLTREPPFFFQRTTGTTEKPKMIPFTRRCQAVSSLTHRIWIYKNLLDNPKLLTGRVMALLNAGIDGYTARGDAYGATSGNIYFRMPPIIRRAYCHLYDIFQIADVEARRYTLLRFAVEQNCSFVFTGNPSGLLAIFEFADRHSAMLIRDIHDGTLASRFAVPDHLRVFALNELRPNPRRARALAKIVEREGKLRPIDYWPDLQSLGCWIGGSMGHFSPMLREWCGERFRFRDVGYMASEGVFSIPLNDDSPDGVLALHAVFFEFVPEREFGRPDAPVLLAHEIEAGQNYQVVITTTGGFYRYAINDVIRVIATKAGSPTIRFLYKGGNVQNLQGELMTVDHVMSTMSALAAELGVRFRHFQVVAELKDRRYFLHIEPAGEISPSALRQVLASFERELGKANENYAQFRADRLMGAAGLKVMKQGWFDCLSKDHLARTGRESQFKPKVFGSAVDHPEMVETSIELE